MYIPKEFSVSDLNEIELFLSQNNFGMLVTVRDNFEPIATHIPFLIKRTGDSFQLEGHISRSNKQCAQLKKGKSILAIFQGPNAYVSSSVYSHENVPTWNYQSIHLYGTIDPFSEEELDSHLNEMMNLHEKGQEKPQHYSELSKEMLSAYKKEILGFRISSYRVEAAYKLSQNRSEKDFNAIVNELDKDTKNEAIVTEMKKCRR